MLVLHKKVNYTSTGADLEEGVGEGSGWGEISQTPKKSHFRGPQMFWIPPPPQTCYRGPLLVVCISNPFLYNPVSGPDFNTNNIINNDHGCDFFNNKKTETLLILSP